MTISSLTPSRSRRGLIGAALALAAGSASAHTGHDVLGFVSGLTHPFGLDHLLAMVAVGVWSATALPAGRRWWGPLAFVVSLTLSALLGALGVRLPGVEALIAGSVVAFGAMLAFGRHLSPRSGLGLIALAAALHGLAHGAELPQGAPFAGYAAGFALTTLSLHALGVGLGARMAGASARVWQWAGGALSSTGLYLLTQI